MPSSPSFLTASKIPLPEGDKMIGELDGAVVRHQLAQQVAPPDARLLAQVLIAESVSSPASTTLARTT